MIRMLLTSGYNFEGYRIVEYLGFLSGETVLGTGFLSEFSAGFSDFFGVSNQRFADKLEQAKDAAIQHLLEKAVNAGANALIGIDIDYNMFSANMIGVIANATAVKIEAIQAQSSDLQILPVMNYVPGARVRPVQVLLGESSIALQLCSYGEPLEALLAQIRLENLFGQTVDLGSIAFFQCTAEEGAGFWHTEFVPIALSQARGICAAEVLLCKTFFQGKQTAHPSDSVRVPYQAFQLSALKKAYGADAFLSFSIEEDSWTCLCGTRNPSSAEKCALCERYKGANAPVGDGLNPLHLAALEKLENAKEIYKFVAELETPPHSPQAKTLLEGLESNANMERLYGNMKSSSLKKIRQFFQE